MTVQSAWSDQSAQQLVRYEALFTLLDEIQSREKITNIAQCVAKRWKYFSNVTCWRLVVVDEKSYQVIDGARGEAQVTSSEALSDWDNNYWPIQHPKIISKLATLVPQPPQHFKVNDLKEIEVLPFRRGENTVALLTVASRHEPFSELDKRFIHLFGGYFVDRISGILLRQAVLASLTQRATYDSLTQLYQRAVVIDRLKQQWAHCQRMSHTLSVIIADVDYFKHINDTYGHLAGDEVLREIGQRFTEGARRGEIVGRYGGEEFLLVLYPCDREAALEAAERFRKLINEKPFEISSGNTTQVTLTISLGVFSTEGNSSLPVETILRQADKALYLAKESGRNRAELADC